MIDESVLIKEIKEEAKKRFAGLDTCVSFEEVISWINQQPKIGEWIPCSERLPEEYGDYLVTFGFNDVGVRMVDSGSFSENGFEFTNVIAWQPLPEAYHE